ncbi:hypothetical protein [Liquorilactobacillus capillatus]|uniref:SnoaL-like domain-containing protein n=1 Tax=Liquorilactobacillus capillatus DSM 19910 TaxID=1423731 RepID=A0A0R1M320_9LACO|nr:hypothetical protein [Liquorilactobacillus capillatus]KRL02407.1 hypothetical protein FC81_GL000751 [Liquorilactobacillus capillatus DSM 19910]
MNKLEINDFIKATYNDVLIDLNEQKIATYFSETYQQTTDMQTTNYQEFISHIKTLKKVTRSLSIDRFKDFIIDATKGKVFLHYIVSVLKKDNSRGNVEVFAVFTLKDNKITRCEEITQAVDNKDLATIGSINE